MGEEEKRDGRKRERERVSGCKEMPKAEGGGLRGAEEESIEE